MAMFREHIAIGAIISMVVVVGVNFYALVTDPWLLLTLFVVTTIGSFLPDVDSDSGMPFYLVFGTMTLAATGVVLLYTLSSSYAADWRFLVGIPLVALAFFWLVVGGVLKRCTHHRGIFHSLPAMLIAGVATVLIAWHYGLSDTVSYVFGAAMAIGFASHLVLDEMHSFVDLEGIPFIPKKSLGTALKLFSDSNRVNIATYLLLAALVYTAIKTPVAEAIFYNDSDVIEIGDGVPPQPEAGGTPSTPGTSGGAGGGTGGSSGGGSGSSQGGSGGSSGGTGDPGSSGSGSTDGSGGAGSTSGGGAPTGGGGVSGGVIDTEEEVLDVLIAEGIVSGSGLLDVAGGTALGSVGGGNNFSGEIIVNGKNVRAYFKTKYDLQEILNGWREQGSLSARGYGLFAASTALRDNNIDAVSFTAEKFEVTYRSRGYLFAVFPITFPVRVAVVPTATEGRVKVRLPWYRFFVREFFTREKLENEIDAVIAEAIKKDAGKDIDVKAALLEATTQFLRKKVGTISDSIYLGTEAL